MVARDRSDSSLEGGYSQCESLANEICSHESKRQPIPQRGQGKYLLRVTSQLKQMLIGQRRLSATTSIDVKSGQS
ncbi:unnamed protein product [Arabidopsis lyrata]|nr:unnamed protein product [Arabidopsis lyrata]